MHALTATEVAALTGLDEKAVRKDVEQGVVATGRPPRFAQDTLVYFYARAAFALHLATEDRKRLFALISAALDRRDPRLELGRGWVLDLAALESDLRARIAAFDAWKGGLVVSEDILGGEPVFAGSRLAVRHVGDMLLRGADPEEIQEDYPYLRAQDLEFARLYATAYPRIGRPRGQAAAG